MKFLSVQSTLKSFTQCQANRNKFQKYWRLDEEVER